MTFKRCLALLPFCIFSFSISAQNLVLNPSFEQYTSCPQGISEFDLAVDWYTPWINLVGDTCSTSDLYHTCAFFFGPPNNILGYQNPRTGGGMGGFIVYEDLFIFSCQGLGGSGWREYAEGTLSSPLIAGQDYCVSFYLNLPNQTMYSSSSLGVYFSNSLLQISCATTGASSALPVTPQLQWGGAAITDTVGWTRLQWNYTATGGERYLTIGNFFGDGGTNRQCANPNALANPFAY